MPLNILQAKKKQVCKDPKVGTNRTETYCEAAGGPGDGMFLMTLDRYWRSSKLLINDYRWTVISLSRLADECNASYSTTKRVVRRLEVDRGVIQSATYKWGDGKQRKIIRVLHEDMEVVETPTEVEIKKAINELKIR